MYELVIMVLNSNCLTSTNTKNHITIRISTHSYRAAFSKRIVLNALSKLIYTGAWLCNQCFLQSVFCICICIVHIYPPFTRRQIYRYILDGKSKLAWELPFPRCLGHLSSA